MLFVQNADELFDIDLPLGFIAAAHTCICARGHSAHLTRAGRTLKQPYLDGWTKDMCGLSRCA